MSRHHDSSRKADASKSAHVGASHQFDEVVLCHLDLVYRIAFKLAGNPHEAEDLVQETFLRANRSYDRFELREYGAKPWLLKILHNVFFTSRSQASKSPRAPSDLTLDDFAAEVEREAMPRIAPGGGTMDWENFDEELKKAVESLAPEFRSVLVLWALGDLSYKEISEVLGCAIGTVMSRLHRARRQLAEVLAGYAAEHGIRSKSDAE